MLSCFKEHKLLSDALYRYLNPTEQLTWIAKLSEANSTQQGNVTVY